MKMKTSVSLSAFQAKPGMPVLFSGGNEGNVATIAELGYDGVDLFVSDPTSWETKQTLTNLQKYNLGVGVIMPAALAQEGLFLGHTDQQIRNQCIHRIGEIMDLADEVGGMVSLGLVRGNRLPEESLTSFYDRYAMSCQALLSKKAAQTVPLLIEPINRYEINTINSVAQGVEFISQYDLPLYLMLDTFHMNIEDVSMGATLFNYIEYVKHIHFLDSNRLAPSMGHLDMGDLYRILETLKYQGYLCLEALPLPDPYTCAKQGATFFAHMKAM